MLRPTPNRVSGKVARVSARAAETPVLASREHREFSQRHISHRGASRLIRSFVRLVARSLAQLSVRRFAHVCYVFAKCIDWARIRYSLPCHSFLFILYHFLLHCRHRSRCRRYRCYRRRHHFIIFILLVAMLISLSCLVDLVFLLFYHGLFDH